MLEGLLSLVVAAEVARTGIEVQTTADQYVSDARVFAESEKAEQENAKLVITYDVTSRGVVTGSLDEFDRIVAETFADSRGWQRTNVKFKKVQSGGRLHMVLASPEEVVKASPEGCSDKLSCTVKPYVLINDVRWMNGSDSYNAMGVSLQRYREMVINHEVGHFLGHNHIASCETDNGQAPIMLQQSTGLRGCQANSWPLPSELWVKGL